MAGLKDDGEIAAAAEFKAAVASGDLSAFFNAVEKVEARWAWKKAFRAIARVPTPPHLRLAFVEAVMAGGEALRSYTNNDRVLVDALRSLLPPYEAPDGAPTLLYRGASRNERRHRCYGHSWSDDLSAARSHAANDGHGGSGLFSKPRRPLGRSSALCGKPATHFMSESSLLTVGF